LRGFNSRITKTLERKLRYRYRCERCGFVTDWFESGVEYTYSDIRHLSKENWVLPQEQLEKIEDNAHKMFDSLLRKIQQALRARGCEVVLRDDPFVADEYNRVFQEGAACPRCGARQTWYPAVSETPAGAPAALRWAFLLGGVGLGLAALFTFLFPDALPRQLVFAGYALPAVLAGAVIGTGGALQKSQAVVDYYNSATEHNKPEVDWGGR